jgi:hypothetical protein
MEALCLDHHVHDRLGRRYYRRMALELSNSDGSKNATI